MFYFPPPNEEEYAVLYKAAEIVASDEIIVRHIIKICKKLLELDERIKKLEDKCV